MSGSRSTSAARRSSRASSPVISLVDVQADAQARAELSRAELLRSANRQSGAEGAGGALLQGEKPKPSHNPPAFAQSFSSPSQRVAREFVAEVTRKTGPDLTAEDLVNAFYARFNLHEVKATREELLPFVLDLQHEVFGARKHVKFAFAPDSNDQAPTAHKPQQQHQQGQQQQLQSPQQIPNPSHQDLQDFVAAYRPDLSEGKSFSGREQKASSLQPPSSGGARSFSSPSKFSTPAQVWGTGPLEEEDDDEDQEDPFSEETSAYSSVPRVNILRTSLGKRLYTSIITKGFRGAQAYTKESCKDFSSRTYHEMLAIGAASDFIAQGRPKDALEVLMRRFHGLNAASQAADPTKAWKAFETLQHPTLSSSILPEDIEIAMARAMKRTANLFSSRSSANYAGASGATAPESGGGSKRG